MEHSLPTGKLNAVVLDWEIRPGFVRVPVKEVIGNRSLTHQARLLWMWLAAQPSKGHHVSWNECEAVLGCATKARRSCLQQLCSQGLLTITPDGVAILHDPYSSHRDAEDMMLKAADAYINWRLEPGAAYEYQSCEKETFKQKSDRIFLDFIKSKSPQPLPQQQSIKEEPDDITVSSYDVISIEKEEASDLPDEQPLEPSQVRDTQEPEAEPEEKPLLRPLVKGSPYQLADQDGILEAWNTCKPQTFSGMRAVSIQQQKCITKHLLNIGLSKDQAAHFICTVCKGLTKNAFWTQQLPKQNRNFKSVFGYGDPNQTKLANIEILYNAGLDEEPTIETKLPAPKSYTDEQQEEINTLSYIKLNLQKAKNAQNESEIKRWTDFEQQSLEKLHQLKVDPSLLDL